WSTRSWAWRRSGGSRSSTSRRSSWSTTRAMISSPRPVSRCSLSAGADRGRMGSMVEYRVERDTMGEVRVPADALYRAQTQRAVENFPISGARLERQHIRALAQIKAAAAEVNADLGVLDSKIAEAIVNAAREVADGEHDGHFPID